MKKNTNKVIKQGSKRTYMKVNVILTFDTPNYLDEMQEFFDLLIPVNKRDGFAEDFIDRKLFKKIVKKCDLLNRRAADLVKISIDADWKVFNAITGLGTLPQLGHDCKWHFGNGRCDLNPWEIQLSKKFGFGTGVDMSWVNEIYDNGGLKKLESRISSILGN